MDLSETKWRKSSRSGEETACVEVAVVPDASRSSRNGIAFRDSKNPEGPVLGIGEDKWAVFARAIKKGRFDLPTT